MAARTFSGAERPKFLMFDPEKGNLCAFLRLITGRNLFRRMLPRADRTSFGLEEVAARMLFGAERPKFLMFKRERV
jgi:hypothetical protein